MNIERQYKLIDKERNIYELADLYPQCRMEVAEYVDLLQDPIAQTSLTIEDTKLVGDNKYNIEDNVANFTVNDTTSDEWKRLNKQFLNYHKSLSVYTLLNAAPIINYIALKTEIGLLKNVKVLDVGGGTGHSHCSFFQFPETIEYYLLDPNLRLLHDQFIRLFPKLSNLKMGHILANAEYLPIKDNSFDVVINISAIDHLDDYKKFISEAFRVLKPGGKFLVSSHLDVPQKDEDKTKAKSKIFSSSFWERVSRYLYYRKHAVGSDDHTLHLEDGKPIEEALLESGFTIKKEEIFKRYFYFVAEKKA
jgi:ubiquinone/menaquinone biosynthesis C-methylase UbiE